MTLPLDPETLAAAYDYLRTTPPFSRWNLPESEDVVFKAAITPRHHGWYDRKKRKHILAVSRGSVGHTTSLMETMAHEMCHLFQALTKTETPGTEHNAAFLKLVVQVCRYHGFDPKAF